MTAQATEAPARRVVRISECCGREVLERETPEEFARAEFDQHGQPPAAVLDLVRGMRDRHVRLKQQST